MMGSVAFHLGLRYLQNTCYGFFSLQRVKAIYTLCVPVIYVLYNPMLIIIDPNDEAASHRKKNKSLKLHSL